MVIFDNQNGTVRQIYAPFVVLVSCIFLVTSASAGDEAQSEARKRVIGATATIKEATTGLHFKARVDTGAKSCSIHVEEFVIDGMSENARENLGKPIRFRLKGVDGQEEWLERKIISTVLVKTSDNGERRYKVNLKLKRGRFEKTVRVTLNDRSHMDYPLLLGRNYLHGDFLVDVELDNNDKPTKKVEPKSEESKGKEATAGDEQEEVIQEEIVVEEMTLEEKEETTGEGSQEQTAKEEAEE